MEEVDIEELKKQRTALKTKVTTSSSRLIKASNRKLASSVITQLYMDLETSYLDFSTVDEKYKNKLESDTTLVESYEVVNNLNLSQYTETVDNMYGEAKNVSDEYFESVKVQKNLKLVQGIAGNVNSLCSRFDVLINRVSSFLKVDNVDPAEIQVDKEELESLTAQLLSYLDKVVQYPEADWDQVTKLINGKIVVSDENRRLLNLRLKRIVPNTVGVSRQPLPASVLPNHLQVQSEVGLSTRSSGATNSFGSGQLPQTFKSSSGIPSSVSESATGFNQLNTDNANLAPQIKIKRVELPTFSGLREDWPEFKTLWPRLALSAFSCKLVLAKELRDSLVGTTPINLVKCIPITCPDSYDAMWTRLSLHYDDAAASVNAALSKLDCLKPVQEEDYHGLWSMIDAVEVCFSQLTTLSQINCLTLRDVDRLCGLLPASLRRDWHRRYHTLEIAEQVQPFPSFMVFLAEERGIITRLVGSSPTSKRNSSVSHQTNFDADLSLEYSECAVHGSGDVGHSTADCGVFQELSRSEKFEKLRSVKACFRCFGNHLRSNCQARDPCDICGKIGHHTLLCMDA